jgi:hypothetical protein
MVYPKLNTHVYKLKRYALDEYICFYFATGGPKRCFHLGVLNVPKTIAHGPMNMALSKKKFFKIEGTHDLINMNHTYIG